MKLATSLNDFGYYENELLNKLQHFGDVKFKNINLEIGKAPEIFSDGEAVKVFSEKIQEICNKKNLNLVVAHAPVIEDYFLDALENHGNPDYQQNLNVFYNSILLCKYLNIKRIVIHACGYDELSKDVFYAYNKMFYTDILKKAEMYNITVMTENVPQPNMAEDAPFRFATGKELREFVDFINHPLMAVCWDTAHANIDIVARKIGQYQNIIDIGDKLKGLHVADNFGDCHHHTWPFAGNINFDSVMQGLLDVNYDGYFTFEASYTLLHQSNPPYGRKPWVHNGKTVSKLQSPSIELKKKAVDLLYEVGKHILNTYNCLEE